MPASIEINVNNPTSQRGEKRLVILWGILCIVISLYWINLMFQLIANQVNYLLYIGVALVVLVIAMTIKVWMQARFENMGFSQYINDIMKFQYRKRI